MQVLFYVVAIGGASLLMLRSRRFDLFTVAFVSALVYFMPGFAGFAHYPPRNGIDALVPLAPECYAVFCAVMASVVASALLFDALPYREPTLRVEGTGRARYAALACTLLGFGGALATTGATLFDRDKDVVLANMNRFYILGSTSVALLAAFAFARKSRALLTLAACALLFDLYVGFRDSAAFSAIAIGTLYLAGRKRRRLATEHWRVAVAGLAAIALLFLYKAVLTLVKLGNFALIAQAMSEPGIYATALLSSEPFVAQASLNEILRQHFQADPGHLVGAVNNLLLFVGDVSGVESFNDLFQPALFPYCRWGMANNIWGEMMASGGWPVLALFLVVFNAVLAAGSYLLRSANPEIRAACAVLGAEWAFYIHRNDLGFQINIEKRTFLVAAVCMGLSALAALAMRSPRRMEA